MITHIIAANIGNIQEHTELAIDKYTVLTGENGTGKSMFLFAPQLTIFGYIPSKQDSVGKQNASVFHHLANDPERPMTVGIVTENHTYERSFIPSGTSVKQQLTIDDTNVSISDGKTAIQDSFGSNSTYFNINEFFALSDEKKRKFVLNFGGGKAMQTPIIDTVAWQTLRNVNAAECDALLKYQYDNMDWVEFNGAERDEVRTQLEQDLLAEEERNILTAIDNEIPDYNEPPLTVFNTVFKWVKDKKSAIRSARKSAKETKNELASQRKQLARVSTPLKVLKDERNKLMTQIEETQAEIAVNKNSIQQMQDLEQDITSLEKSIKGVEKKIGVLAEDITQTKQRQTDFAEVKDRVREYFDAKAEMARYQEQIHTLQNYDGSTCHICNRALDDGMKKSLIADYENLIEKHTQPLREIESSVGSLFLNSDAIFDQAKNWDDDLYMLRQEVNTNEERLQEHRETLEHKQSRLAEFETSTDTESLQQALDGYRERLDEVNDKISAKERAEEIQTTIQQKSLTLEKAKAQWQMMKHIETAVQTVRDQYLKTAAKPFTAEVNNLLQRMNPFWEFGIRFDPYFEFVVYKDGNAVPVDSHSAGEFVDVSIAILLALIQQGEKIDIPTLLIEAGEVDNDRMEQILTALPSACDDWIGNVLIARWVEMDVPEPWQSMNFNVNQAA